MQDKAETLEEPSAHELLPTNPHTKHQLKPVIPKRRKHLKPNEKRKILSLFLKGNSKSLIAKVMHRDISTITNCINSHKQFLTAFKARQEYNTFKTDIITAAEYRMLKSCLDTDKHKRASLSEASASFERLNRVRRLEAGKSTSNTAISVTVSTRNIGNVKE